MASRVKRVGIQRDNPEVRILLTQQLSASVSSLDYVLVLTHARLAELTLVRVAGNCPKSGRFATKIFFAPTLARETIALVTFSMGTVALLTPCK